MGFMQINTGRWPTFNKNERNTPWRLTSSIVRSEITSQGLPVWQTQLNRKQELSPPLNPAAVVFMISALMAYFYIQSTRQGVFRITRKFLSKFVGLKRSRGKVRYQVRIICTYYAEFLFVFNRLSRWDKACMTSCVSLVPTKNTTIIFLTDHPFFSSNGKRMIKFAPFPEDWQGEYKTSPDELAGESVMNVVNQQKYAKLHPNLQFD